MRTFCGVVPAILVFLFESCMVDSPVKSDYRGFQPLERNDDWAVSSAADEKMDNSLLESAFRLVYEENRYVMARSLIVLRNGKIVGEIYPHDPGDADRIQNIQSCTKSFTSILTGIALTKGLLDSAGQLISTILAEDFSTHPDKKDITIEDALTMRTGIDFNDDKHTLDLYQGAGNSIDYVLSLPKKYPAGVVFHYHDGSPQLVSAAVQKRYGKSLSSFGEEFLLKPLHITEWKWESAKDGITFGAFSLFLKPRDIAKFGQLLLNNGRWNGKQIVDSHWIFKATQPRVNSDAQGASYGYYFWVYPAYPGYAAIGHGGQRIFVVPSKQLVVVYTAWPYTSDILFDNFAELADLIVKSCR
jgi:CubicO group peptidase (beta-lactamase class C family)